MMGLKTTEPKLYYSFSLDAAVPSDHISAGSHPALTSVSCGSSRRFYSRTGMPRWTLSCSSSFHCGYLFDITSERRLCQEAGLHLA
jgi:hypothetical protein